MAALNQLELGSLRNPRRDINEGNNVDHGDNYASDRCRTRGPVVSILASLPCKLKSFWCVHDCSPAPTKTQQSRNGEKDVEAGSFGHRKQGGWKTMPFIIGNEACEKLATLGLSANLIVYLTRQFHMSNVMASNVLNVWIGTTNLTPLLGAFLSDSYIGRYRTISLGCIASLMGMTLLSLTAIFPQFRPPPCNTNAGSPCRLASGGQNALLYSSFAMMAIGAGGIRPCSVAFGADQFDYTNENGRRSIESFFNWYYFSYTISMMVALTVIVYIQTISWIWGLGIPAFLMFLSITSFLLGAKLYICVTPEGSSFTSFLQVLIGAGRKRHLSFPSQTSEYYDPPQNGILKSRMALTDQFMFLNKASIKTPEDLKEAFSAVGQIEFLYSQFPENMRSIAGALFFLSMGLGNYLSSFIVSIVDKTTGGQGHPSWLAQNLNKAKLDNFYWLIAGYSAVNLVYFVIIAHWYRYKATINDQTARSINGENHQI